VEADEGDMLTLDTHHPPRSHEHLILFLTSREPSLNAPNSELRAIKPVVQTKPEGSPTNNIQTSKGNDWKRISKVKIDLSEWMILFQPELSQEDKVIT